jgi:nucleoid-associated protein YgaU
MSPDGAVPAPGTAPRSGAAPAPSPDAPPADAALDRPEPDAELLVPVGVGSRVVVRGDNLWAIATEQVAAATGDDPDIDATRRYWTALVAENRWSLASGDPDVIYPGEVLRLPPVDA